MLEQKGKLAVETDNTSGEAKQWFMTNESFDALVVNADLLQVDDLFLFKVPVILLSSKKYEAKKVTALDTGVYQCINIEERVEAN